MLFARGKAKYVEEFVALYLMKHPVITVNGINKKIYEETGVQITISTVRSVIYEMRAWNYIATNNVRYGDYVLTKTGMEYYSNELGNFSYLKTDKDNVNV